jgi:hypothetical protein
VKSFRPNASTDRIRASVPENNAAGASDPLTRHAEYRGGIEFACRCDIVASLRRD